MINIVDYIASIGIQPNDREDAILQKRFLVYQALLMSGGGILWGILALVLNREWQSTVPFGYVLITAVNLLYFHHSGDFRVVKAIQTGISLLLPFLFQWVLGGFIASGAVMLWALMSLAASVTYQSNRKVAFWLGLYIVLTLFSGYFDQNFKAWIRPDDAEAYSVPAMVMNIAVISTILLWLVNFVVRGKNEALQRLQEAQLQVVQSEKMATLGTLAAGVAHELNNPAAATRRASQQLRTVLSKLEQARLEVDHLDLSPDDREFMNRLEKQALNRSTKPVYVDSLQRADDEANTEEWLEDHAIENAWELAPALVSMGLCKKELSQLAPAYDETPFRAIVVWAAHLYPVYSLLHEISEGSGRISEIVVALKNYSFLGQAPIQQVNVHEGIENTLIILRSKLKAGITVHRAYCAEVLEITAYGSELNQVWTNLIDNAIGAMDSNGELTIRTRKDKNCVAVEIEDNGPGIPAEIQSRIFDPFFTTKAPGQGTGLGLSTCYGIITEKHKGSINVQSKPGKTTFTVKLPIHYLIPDCN
ncbi:ATP-binding protein [Larkinella rosea]|uniref:histidine kinase n=1 Tax=Larkinella rosea TaxID=2025312 RepID=A0A3P1BNB2_9BACT|nr:ATP-binding protein [Larkinella rosea]RRB02559.1 GHKL domain-containing protein [Larkinella rosea]